MQFSTDYSKTFLNLPRTSCVVSTTTAAMSPAWNRRGLDRLWTTYHRQGNKRVAAKWWQPTSWPKDSYFKQLLQLFTTLFHGLMCLVDSVVMETAHGSVFRRQNVYIVLSLVCLMW